MANDAVAEEEEDEEEAEDALCAASAMTCMRTFSTSTSIASENVSRNYRFLVKLARARVVEVEIQSARGNVDVGDWMVEHDVATRLLRRIHQHFVQFPSTDAEIAIRSVRAIRLVSDDVVLSVVQSTPSHFGGDSHDSRGKRLFNACESMNSPATHNEIDASASLLFQTWISSALIDGDIHAMLSKIHPKQAANKSTAEDCNAIRAQIFTQP